SEAASRATGIQSWRREPRAPKNSKLAATGVKCHGCVCMWGMARRTATANSTNKYASIRFTSENSIFEGGRESVKWELLERRFLLPGAEAFADNLQIRGDFYPRGQSNPAPKLRIVEAKIFEVNAGVLPRCRLGDQGILCPFEIHAAEIGLFGHSRYRCLGWLGIVLKQVVIQKSGSRIYVGAGEETWHFRHGIPMCDGPWVRINRGSHRFLRE